MKNLTIKGWRLERKLTQKEMAEKMGVSVVTYEKYEKYPLRAKVGTFKVICNILNVDIGDIDLP